MKYYIKKKLALILAASMTISQTSFIFAATDTEPTSTTTNSDATSDEDKNEDTVDSQEVNEGENVDDSNADDKDSDNKTDIADDSDTNDDDASDDSDDVDADDDNINSDDDTKTDNSDDSDTADDDEDKTKDTKASDSDKYIENFNTSLTFGDLVDGYTYTKKGLNAKVKGDNSFMSDTAIPEGGEFTYSANVVFNERVGAAALTFGSFNFNLQAGGECKVFGNGMPEVPKYIGRINAGEEYKIQVRVKGTELRCFVDGEQVISTTLNAAPSGKLGLLTWALEGADDPDTDITYNNLILKASVDWEDNTGEEDYGVTLKGDPIPVTFTVSADDDVYTWSDEKLIAEHNGGGDRFIASNAEIPESGNFIYSTTVTFNKLPEKASAAALTFDIVDGKANEVYATNLDGNAYCKSLAWNRSYTESPGEKSMKSVLGNIAIGDEAKSYKLTIVCQGKNLSYYVDGNFVFSGVLNKIPEGNVGVLTYIAGGDTKITYSNITLQEIEGEDEADGSDTLEGDGFNTNLSKQLYTKTNGYEIIDEGDDEGENGLHIAASGRKFLVTKTIGEDFVYSTDVTFNDRQSGSAGIVFRALENEDSMYVANLSRNGDFRIYRLEGETGSNIVPQGNIYNIPEFNKARKATETHNLKVVCIGKQVSYYIDDIYVAGSADYLSPSYPELYNGYGQNEILLSGALGFLTQNADVTYQNAYYTKITNQNTSALKDLQITGDTEYDNVFSDFQYIYHQYVSNDTDSIDIKATPINSSTNVVVKRLEMTNSGGRTYPLPVEEIDPNNISLNEGHNFFTIETSLGDVSTVYHLSVTRRGEEYYNEPYRDQYHFSVKEGWGNDPNGLLKDKNGVYHLFYQAYPTSPNWGPMHWFHATSKDLITWEDQPIAIYPNQYGTAFSGCGIYDENNTSGLFGSGNDGGYILMITAHGGDENGSGQRMTLAYSKDGYTNWKYYDGQPTTDGYGTKTDGVVIDWTDGKISDDAGLSKAFRDPKVFRYDDKWFVVIAGGNLRIFSSDNLIDWELEATYTFADKRNDASVKEHGKDATFFIETECPDLFRLPTPEGDFKWVLSYGGRNYRIGDFKKVGDNYQFVADEEYQIPHINEVGQNYDNTGIMNFALDFYAAMTYYISPSFNTDTNPRVISLNWMNNWAYCNDVDNWSNNTRFNGTYNLQLELGLTRDADGKLVLTQTPIEEYDKIISKTPALTYNEDVSGTQTLDFEGDCYLVEATFTPDGSTTEFGLNLRTNGEGQKTVVKYNTATKKLSIDRSNSSISAGNDAFKAIAEQVVNETQNADGSITLHIYVDRASLEVFSRDYTVTGAVQIFPNPDSKGIEVYSVGGTTTADIEIKEIESIWGTVPEPETPKPSVVEKVDLTDAIANINGGNYVVNGNDYNTQKTVENWLKQKINALDLSGASIESINITNFTPASDEKEGSFEFTVTIAKGTTKATSAQLSGTITILDSSADYDIQKVIDVINFSDYVVSGKTANTKSKVKDWLEKEIKKIDITEFSIDDIDIEQFTAATSTEKGSFKFTVTISKGEGEDKITLTSDRLNGEITKLGSSSSGGGSGKTGSNSSYRGDSSSNSSKDDTTSTPTTPNDTATPSTPSTTPSNTNTSASIEKFTDVANHWAVDSIKFVVERGYFAGTSENSFSPDVFMTRAMVVSVLGRVANAQGNPITKFVDVDSTQYYAPFIGWALQNGIASGVSETEFSPNTNVTREQLAVMFANFMKQQGFTLDATREANFTDGDKISPWAAESVEFMVKAGILNGRTDGSFDPQGIATRAEVATVLKLFLEKTNQ